MRRAYKSLIIIFIILISVSAGLVVFKKLSSEKAGPPARYDNYDTYQEYEKAGQTELLDYLKKGDLKKLDAAGHYFLENEKKVEEKYGFYQPNPWAPYCEYLKGNYKGPDIIRMQFNTKEKVIAYLEGPDSFGGKRPFLHIEPERFLDNRIDRVVKAIGIKPGTVGAEIGFGEGYYVFFFSSIAERVYAVDVEMPLVEYLKGRLKARGIKNVMPILATFENPMLPKNTVDWVFMFDVYHCMSESKLQPSLSIWLANIRSAMKPGGKIAIIDQPRRHKDSMSEIDFPAMEKQMKKIGFRHIETFEPQPGDPFKCAIFEK